MVSFRVPDRLAVFVGGVVGTVTRADLDKVSKASPVHGLFLPQLTLTVNTMDTFLLGALVAWVAGCLARGSRSVASLKSLKLLAGTSFTGAFTTYGTYIVVSVGYASFSRTVETIFQPLGLLVLGGACAWAGTRVGEWLCVPLGARPVSGEEKRA